MSHASSMPRLHLLSGWAFPPGAMRPLARALEPMASVTTAQAAPPDLHASSRQVLIGWSLGGLLALQAVATGARPRALVLISSTARFTSTPTFPAGVEPPRLRALSRALARQPDEALRGFYDLCARPHAHPVEPPDLLLAAARRLGPTVLAQGLDHLNTIDLRANLPAVTVPVLLLHGTHDAVIPVAAARWLHEHLPTSQLILHPETGHDLPLRNPAWCAARILHFIESCA